MDHEAKIDVARVFGSNQKFFRENKSWLQTDLAKKLQAAGLPKYSQVAVSRTEEGKRTVRLDEAMLIAKVLGVTMDQLLSPPDSFVRRLEILRKEQSNVYGTRHDLIRAAQDYERTRHAARTIVDDFKATEERLSLPTAQKKALDMEMSRVKSASVDNAVVAVQPHVLTGEEYKKMRESEAAANGND